VCEAYYEGREHVCQAGNGGKRRETVPLKRLGILRRPDYVLSSEQASFSGLGTIQSAK
jgi:hypothetical protein